MCQSLINNYLILISFSDLKLGGTLKLKDTHYSALTIITESLISSIDQAIYFTTGAGAEDRGRACLEWSMPSERRSWEESINSSEEGLRIVCCS